MFFMVKHLHNCRVVKTVTENVSNVNKESHCEKQIVISEFARKKCSNKAKATEAAAVGEGVGGLSGLWTRVEAVTMWRKKSIEEMNAY